LTREDAALRGELHTEAGALGGAVEDIDGSLGDRLIVVTQQESAQRLAYLAYLGGAGFVQLRGRRHEAAGGEPPDHLLRRRELVGVVEEVVRIDEIPDQLRRLGQLLFRGHGAFSSLRWRPA
jgi:hypothetical protein